MSSLAVARPHEMSSLLGLGRFSDFILECGEYEFKVHRVILSTDSQFFYRLCDEEAFVEGRTGRATFPDDAPALICRLLQFIYLDGYSAISPSHDAEGQLITQFQGVVDEHDNDLQQWYTRAKIHMEMYKLGEKYNVSGLSEYAFVMFLKSLQNQDIKNGDLNSAGVCFQSTTVQGITVRINFTMDDARVNSWAIVVKAVYELALPNPMKFRIPVITIMHFLNETQSALKLKSFRNIFQDNPLFAVDMVLFQRHSKAAVCQSCRKFERMVLGQCACGNVDGCDESNCQHQWEEETYCFHCLEQGVLQYPGL